MSYSHLTINERACIYQFLNLKMSIREIAKALNRSPSTISREIKRNSSISGSRGKFYKYFPKAAQKKYDNRRINCHRNIKANENELSYIEERLNDNWSPEQVYHRSLLDKKRIPSTSTIYRYIHKKQLKKIRIRHLRRKGKFKRPAETRGRFNDGGRTIKKRDKDVYKRNEPGHWEGDTVESGRIDHKRKSKYCFVTLAERKSRMYIAILVPSKSAADVTPAIIEALKDFPDELVKTITFDRGKEFSGYEEIEKVLNCKTYFCDPYCAWQKGTNENTNGLLREYFPKGMDLSEVNQDDLEEVLDKMNNRPRKCLGYKTPKEVLKI